MKNLLILLSIVLLSSCAQTITVNYSMEPENNSTLVLQPVKAVNGTYVTINDQMIVNKKYVKKVIIKKLPEGEHTVNMSSESWYYKTPMDYKETVTVKNGQETTKLVTVPPYSNGYWAYVILMPLVGVGASILIGGL